MKHVARLICLLLISASSVLAEDVLPWGLDISRAACGRLSGGVWSDYQGGADCLRYFAGGDIDRAAIVIVVLRGDRDAWVTRSPDAIPLNTADQQTALARALAEDMGFPVILLSRPGTFGSGGDHLRRRQAEEFLALDAALDGIRADHSIERFVLLGHSGGATAAAALMTLGRRDIACAVLVSGAYGLLERAEWVRQMRDQRSRPGLDLTGLPEPYDALDHLDGIPDDPSRKIVVIGNQVDRVTPFYLQQRFHEGLLALGHQAELKSAPARAPEFHNLLGNIGPRTAAACASEAP